MSLTLNPYLTFNGTAEQAIALYESALGAKTEHLQRFGEVPGTPEGSAHRNRIIHAMLRIGDGVVMISDSMPDQPVAAGANVHVCLQFTDLQEVTKRFDALAAGGQITMPLDDTFWGARFGMLVDAFGVPWMFNCPLK